MAPLVLVVRHPSITFNHILYLFSQKCLKRAQMFLGRYSTIFHLFIPVIEVRVAKATAQLVLTHGVLIINYCATVASIV